MTCYVSLWYLVDLLLVMIWRLMHVASWMSERWCDLMMWWWCHLAVSWMSERWCDLPVTNLYPTMTFQHHELTEPQLEAMVMTRQSKITSSQCHHLNDLKIMTKILDLTEEHWVSMVIDAAARMIMSCHVLSRHLTNTHSHFISHVISRHVTSSHVISRHLTHIS